MRTPRFTLIDQARMALFASLLASAVVFMATAATDPFGKSDRAAKHAAGVALCTQLQSNTQRLDQLNRIIEQVGMSGLTRNERDVYDLSMANRERLLDAISHVNATCDGGGE